MRLLLACAAVAAAATAGCNDDSISHGRADTGVLPSDGGTNEALQLVPGMAFAYHGILTRRGAANDEQTSQYTLTLTIDSADDRGSNGDSALQVHASNFTTTAAADWMAPYDFDGWVARLGPSLRDDRVSADPVTAHLEQVPQIPPPPASATTKILPVADTFFLDMRHVDVIRAHFAETYATRMPQVTDPMTTGKWIFSLTGTDDTIVYYAQHTRRIVLTYDPRGFLTRMDESISDADHKPFLVSRIDLTSGP